MAALSTNSIQKWYNRYLSEVANGCLELPVYEKEGNIGGRAAQKTVDEAVSKWLLSGFELAYNWLTTG
ncbi:uncharacterized protein NFIA_043800 [Aspergillus fischeri NRRL 181]|uniref:Uncharacterized protein n=1 Tax=Neosartorya fischeri (strain ATCC 1020 / DSM 3700 / CBS 544.65 / FGSC A1164 / JCM 1740 / NRRL 181 / WB 181) TaxID=331117 RepID=A1CUY4_NEOFI|nr:uncharacterized protein NFIA_043800 [Aspergillus fischeri NRRL 181]EAW25561.1 hypothetical protein NFIA_043800 [Aspergillus fischeri NRRL 181]